MDTKRRWVNFHTRRSIPAEVVSKGNAGHAKSAAVTKNGDEETRSTASTSTRVWIEIVKGPSRHDFCILEIAQSSGYNLKSIYYIQ
jgi:hypothetical protein